MLKAKLETPDGKVNIVIGLSQLSVERLIKKKPIGVDLTDYGAPGVGLILVYGKDEMEITQDFLNAGYTLPAGTEEQLIEVAKKYGQ